jgi:hypothetical protein
MTQNTETAPETQTTPRDILPSLVGKWAGTTRTWFEPNVIADESEWKGEIRLVLDGLYALYEYQGSLGGKSLEGIALIGYNPTKGRFESAWADTLHTGPAMLISQGVSGAGLPLSYLGSYADPSGGPDWGWRTELVLRDADTLVITAYNIQPGEEEQKAVETIYTRVVE